MTELEITDLKTDVYMDGNSKRYVKMTHLPTGMCVEGNRSEFSLRHELTTMVEAKARK